MKPLTMPIIDRYKISKVLICFVLAVFAASTSGHAKDHGATIFTLQSSVDHALKHNPRILSSKEAVAAAQANKNGRFSEFLPKLSGNYGYKRLDEEGEFVPGVITSPQDQYTFTATLDQPVFSGFSQSARFEISKLELEVARYEKKRARQDLVYEVKEAYFKILQTLSLEMVARQAVNQLASHAEVAGNFYDVGMIPKNDLLKTQVELANAKLDLVVATNTIELAKSRFNILLQRPIDAPFSIEKVGKQAPFTKSYKGCLEVALKQRPERQLAALAVEKAQRGVTLAKKDYYPSVNLQANYFKTGDTPDINGGTGISDAEEWNLAATASWTFWQWGKTRFGVIEKLKYLSQVKLNMINVENDIRQEVKTAYLRLKEAESNIVTEKMAVTQAKENFRISEERYKEQVATSTEVIDARTLLTKTQNNYFNALTAFNLSRAALNRATGTKESWVGE